MTIYGASELAVSDYIVFAYEDYLVLAEKYGITHEDEHILGGCTVTATDHAW